MKNFLLLLFLLSMAVSSCNAKLFHRNPLRKTEKGLFGKSMGKKRVVKVREPRKVVKAKKKQEAKERKNKKDYEQFVKRSQKRTFDIQTPDVQTRMKQDKKDSAKRDRLKKKNYRTSTRGAGKKYK